MIHLEWTGGEAFARFFKENSMKVQIGDNVFVRGTTRDDYVGKLVENNDLTGEVTLDRCSWVAVSGRFHTFLRDGTAEGMEIEPMGDGWSIRRSAIGPWKHKLFTEAV